MNFIKVIKYILTEKSNKGHRLRRLISGIGWQLWKRIIKKPIIIKLDNGADFISFPNTVMGSFPIYSRIYDSENILFIRSFLTRNGIMLDIGANAGIYSLLLKDKITKSLLFEPIPETAEMCRMNMCINDLDFRIYNSAIGNMEGAVNFKYSGDGDPTAKIDKENSNGTRVKIEKLDNIVNKNLLNKIEFIKIDVEGNEIDVLLGGIKILESSSTRLIQFERLKNTPIDPILTIFKKYKWRVFALSEDGKPTILMEDIIKSHDLFAVPETELSKILL